MKGKSIQLRPNHQLLNPNFDGYKLYNQDVRVYSKDLSEGLWTLKQEETYSYLYTRILALHNYLIHDPYQDDIYIFTSSGVLVKYQYSEDFRLSQGETIFSLNTSPSSIAEKSHKEENSSPRHIPYLPPSLHFTSDEFACVSNGCGRLVGLSTDRKSTANTWKEVLSYDTVSSTILNSRLKENNNTKELNILLHSLSSPNLMKENEKYKDLPNSLKENSSSHCNIIIWLTFELIDGVWKSTRERHLSGLGSIEYCAFNEDVSDVILLCHHNYTYIYDSSKDIVQDQQNGQNKKSQPDYVYVQNDDDIIVWLKIDKDSGCKIDVTNIKLKVQLNDKTLVEGSFSKHIESSAVTWAYKDDKLEITLPKSNEGEHWDCLFSSSDQIGEEIMDSSTIEEMQQKLLQLNTNNLGNSSEFDKPAYNPEQLEDCDEVSEDLILLQINGDTHDKTVYSYLGATQHLLNIPEYKCGGSPSFCLRHDVDGVVWYPENNEFTHKSTFHAFGYVRASKHLAKFVQAPSDCSYVAISDLKSHLYIFCQKDLFGGELRNRKSGKVTNTIARQILVSLKTHDEVLGMCTMPESIWILTEKQVYVYDFLFKN